MLTVGFVCEGITDHPIVEAVVEAIVGDFEPRYLQPEFDLLNPSVADGGWTRVREWCLHWASTLDYLPDPPDAIIVHVDADVRGLVGATTTEQLCEVVRGWLGPSARRHGLVIAIPKESSEAWLLAAHMPANPALEQERQPVARLAKQGLIRTDGHGRPVKDRSVYAGLAAALTAKLPVLRPVLAELDRFASKLEVLVRK